uniref:TruE3 n=1 Tax=uncultured Prochloron sp. TaxID=259942 RepID=B2KYH4_9PROC|nr:TruE3 [uncultured Prochloron sp.]
MNKKNILPQLGQPVIRLTAGQLSSQLAELSEEALGGVDASTSIAPFCSYDGVDASTSIAPFCSYDGVDASTSIAPFCSYDD